ncbi:MFS general substrate transporter [Ascobolus immersus RN42]|uniref:MFS general substrate transporter n=1 Tax=Ascobolus immersus RN42 TaxID=1160509 RepID=A0A3N4I133_ASCIM|nr:MFS general substrate transporter [Ascobolus immersus RN42]
MPVVSLYQSRNLGIHVEDLDEEEGLLVTEGDGSEEDRRSEQEEEEEYEKMMDGNGNGWKRKRQLGMIYTLHLADAIVIASLQPQLYILLKDTNLCGSADSTYWAGIVESVFALGSVAGLYWGCLSDRVGRRPIALMGLLGMCMSALIMGFSTSALVCAIVRFFGGFMASSLRTMVWTMLGDVSRSSKSKANNFSRLPLVSIGGLLGPIMQAALAHRFGKDGDLWKMFPILSSQLACAGLILLVLIANFFLLEETLPVRSSDLEDDAQLSYESASGLLEKEQAQSYLRETDQYSLDSPTETTFTRRRRPIVFSKTETAPLSLMQIMKAPSFMVLLISFSYLCLHTTTYDQLLPLIGNSPTSKGGLGLPCSILSLVVFITGVIAAAVLYSWFGRTVERFGLLRFFRICSWLFPVVYVTTPLVASISQFSEVVAFFSSVLSILLKSIIANFAQTLVVILVLNTSPDAFSLGTLMGFLQASTVLRSLAVGAVSLAMGLSGKKGDMLVNGVMWTVLTVIAIGGAIGAGWVKDKSIVGRDYTVEELKWEVAYDVESSGDEEESP